MRLFLRFVLSFVLLLVFVSVLLPVHYKVEFPRDPGPVLDPGVRLVHKRYIEENQPKIVLLGDSTLDDGVDPELLAQQAGVQIYSIPVHGSASAMWYLLLKNNIVAAEHKPDYVLVVFRTSVLTAPAYRVQGKYFEALDEFAGVDEPIFLEKSFINFMNPLEVLAGRYLPLYVLRLQVRREIESGVLYAVPSTFSCDRVCVDTSLNTIFYGKNLEPGVLADAVNIAESYLYTPEQLNFESQLEGSYLPDMIQIARDNGINLVFVRIKIAAVDENSSPELVRYLASLKTYFEKQNVDYLDYGNDPRLPPDLYSDTVHLGARGERVFTQILAEDMVNLLKEK